VELIICCIDLGEMKVERERDGGPGAVGTDVEGGCCSSVSDCRGVR
jgi:hypothetical protein